MQYLQGWQRILHAMILGTWIPPHMSDPVPTRLRAGLLGPIDIDVNAVYTPDPYGTLDSTVQDRTAVWSACRRRCISRACTSTGAASRSRFVSRISSSPELRGILRTIGVVADRWHTR